MKLFITPVFLGISSATILGCNDKICGAAGECEIIAIDETAESLGATEEQKMDDDYINNTVIPEIRKRCDSDEPPWFCDQIYKRDGVYLPIRQ